MGCAPLVLRRKPPPPALNLGSRRPEFHPGSCVLAPDAQHASHPHAHRTFLAQDIANGVSVLALTMAELSGGAWDKTEL